jgi:30S ribosomal protein S31
MGKGDQRSKRGKIHRGTFGRRRPKPKTHKRIETDAAGVEAADAPAAKAKEAKVVKKQPKE